MFCDGPAVHPRFFQKPDSSVKEHMQLCDFDGTYVSVLLTALYNATSSFCILQV